jgi:hypothetical protein
VNATAGIFATYPGDHLSILGGVIDQVPVFYVTKFLIKKICVATRKRVF